MATVLIAYLSTMLEQWDMLAAEVRQELENAERSELIDYYSYMMIRMQLARDELAAGLASAIAAQTTDT